MERLWSYMFTENKPLINAIGDVLVTKLERYILKYISKKYIS